ncbi:MAG: toxin HicA [Actinomycetota bacterium]|nr:toxin HicA [Actinomycetota bacterium]MDP2288170.1 toxin HicA [Actinomycetota bacterium]
MNIYRLSATCGYVNRIRYNDLLKVCEHYFGQPRSRATSHAVFRTSWPGDPRVNIQNDHGKAKAYRVQQVLAAIAKKEEHDDDEAQGKAVLDS